MRTRFGWQPRSMLLLREISAAWTWRKIYHLGRLMISQGTENSMRQYGYISVLTAKSSRDQKVGQSARGPEREWLRKKIAVTATAYTPPSFSSYFKVADREHEHGSIDNPGPLIIDGFFSNRCSMSIGRLVHLRGFRTNLTASSRGSQTTLLSTGQPSSSKRRHTMEWPQGSR